MKFKLPNLPYPADALEPFMSEDQLRTHYTKHHQAYIDKVNKAVEEMDLKNVTLEKLILNHDGDLFNNAAQAWNHTFFWYGLSPKSQRPSADGLFMKSVNKNFEGLEDLKSRLIDSAVSLFGSGYTWIVSDEHGEVQIMNTHNADNPIRLEHTHPLWCCDVWEHAYYVDYRQERKKYLEQAWNHINWEFVEQCYQLKQIPNMTRLMVDQGDADSVKSVPFYP